MSRLAKYRHVFVVGLQSNLVYRWNFAIRAGFSLFHLVMIFLLWGTAFAGKTSIGGFSLPATMTYFITTLVMQFFIGGFNEDYQISEEIRNGLINQFLLKPINYFVYRLSIFTSARIVSGLLSLIPLALAYPLLKDHIELPHELWRLGFGLPAMAIAALIQFSIAFCFGLLTFWFLEIHSFIILSLAIETVFAGQVFPLDLINPTLFNFSQYLPYYYQMYFPVAILTGRVPDWETAAKGLVLGAIWALILLGIAKALWQRGLRRHTAVGG